MPFGEQTYGQGRRGGRSGQIAAERASWRLTIAAGKTDSPRERGPVTQGAQPGLRKTPEARDGEAGGRGDPGGRETQAEGAYAALRLTHADV